MLLIYKYCDPTYLKETYSIHVIKRGKYTESFNELNKHAFELILKRMFKDNTIATMTRVYSKQDLQYKDNLVSDFI